MSLADELLDGVGMTTMAVDTDDGTNFVIGSDRFVTIPEALKKIGVQYDHNVETITFDCPRYWDGRDLSEMYVYINYMRPDGELGCHLCENVVVDTADDTLMHFDWTISGHVTYVKGNLNFLVCIKKEDSEGNQVNHWNSELNSDLYISGGLECDEQVVEQYPDIISHVLTQMEYIDTVTSERVEYMNQQIANFDTNIVQAVNDSAAAAAQSEVNAAGSATAAASSANTAAQSAAAADNSADIAESRMNHAGGYATDAAASEANAETYKNLAKSYSDTAAEKANTAATSEANANTSEVNAEASSIESESWAVGGTGTRVGEDTDNSKYYSEQAQAAQIAAEQARDDAQAIAGGNFASTVYVDQQDAVTLQSAKTYVDELNAASIETMTVAEFEALTDKDANTLYMLTDAEEEAIGSVGIDDTDEPIDGTVVIDAESLDGVTPEEFVYLSDGVDDGTGVLLADKAGNALTPRTDAKAVSFDNTTSDSAATNVEDALNEVIARPIVPRRNLLDNPRFKVNQRELTTLSHSADNYQLDRWFGYNCDGSFDADGNLVLSGRQAANGIKQRINTAVRPKAGDIVTLSALVKGTAGQSFRYYIGQTNGTSVQVYPTLTTNDWELFTIQATVTGDDVSQVCLYPNGSSTETDAVALTVKAVKLEVGEGQTLTYKDANGAWQLYDDYDYTADLLECQRYYRQLDMVRVAVSSTKTSDNGEYLTSSVIFSDMVAIPTVTLLTNSSGNTYGIEGVSSYNDMTAWSIQKHEVSFRITTNTHAASKIIVIVGIVLSAEL